MFGWARRLVGLGAASAPAPARAHHQPIRARYDNAQQTDDNRRSWWTTDTLSAKSANSFQVRRTLRMRSRHEVANNPYLFGVANSNADDLVGRGPTLQVLSKSAAYNRQVEAAWSAWAAETDLVEKLRTIKLARTVDGEGFLVLKTVQDLDHAVKLYPVDIEADQVTTPAPANLEQLWVDGLELHPVTGRPTWFSVLKHHPGDYFFPDFSPLRVERVRAKHVVHWYPKFRPGQVRGVPVFTSALDLFNELRSFRKAVLAKAQIAANLTAVIQTKAPADTTDVDADTVQANTATNPFDSLQVDRGMLMTLPWDATLSQFSSGEPSTTYEMFQEKCLAEACRPLGYPLNLALGTSQKFNFSSAKLDHINYRDGLGVERGQCETAVLGPIFRAWLEEALKVPGLLPRGASLEATPHEWHWPGFTALDVAADTAAEIAQLNGGTLTWREFWARRGYDWHQVMAQQGEEKKEIERLGISFGEPMKKSERLDGDPPEGTGKKSQAERRLERIRSEWKEGDQPRDELGRFGAAEHHPEHDDWSREDHATERANDRLEQKLNDKHEREADKLAERHGKEDEKAGKANDRAEEAVGKARDKEDAARDKVREKEDKETDRARAADEKRDERREKDDEALEERRGKEDERVEKGRYKEDAALSKARDAEDEERVEQREKEDADSQDAREAEDEAVGAKREAEDAATAKAREGLDADEHAEKWEAEDGAAQDARDAEDEARQAARDKEDEELGPRREREDEERETARGDEDAEIEEKRQAEDEEREAGREAEDEATAKARAEEDAATEAREEAVDAREVARADEDDAIATARDAEDEARQAAEDERTDRQAAEVAEMEARHAAEKKAHADAAEKEAREAYRERKGAADAHRAYYTADEHEKHGGAGHA